MFKYKQAIAILDSFAVCVECGQKFQQPKIMHSGTERFARNKTCSRQCSQQYQNRIRKENNPGFYWSDEETKLLIEWIQRLPVHKIYQDWNTAAKKRGWKLRPYHQILNKAQRLAKTEPKLKGCYVENRSVGKKRIHVLKDNWALQDLKRILGIRRYGRVLRWVHKKGLEYQDLSGSHNKYYAVSRKALRKFASQHPEEFWGIRQRDLRKVLPKKLADLLYKINRERQPTNGRGIPVVRLDTGDVYRSGTAAATALKLCTSRLIECAKSDATMPNGMDFYRFDYPTYWVPPDVKEEFNLVAGKVLYTLYLDICNVTGYQKQSCLLVAARLAIQTTLTAFRSREKKQALNKEVEPIEVITEFWRGVFFNKLTYVYQISPSHLLNKINYIISKRIFKNCYAIANGDRELAKEYANDFCNYYIQKEIAKFYKYSYLPVNYTPRDKLQHADLWANIYGSLNITLWLGKKENGTLKAIPWIQIAFIHFCRHYKLQELPEEKITTNSYNSDWKYHNNNEDDKVSTSAAEELESLLASAKEILNGHTYEQLELLVALKLSEASDAEIADCLNIKVVEIPKMLNLLAKARGQTPKRSYPNRLGRIAHGGDPQTALTRHRLALRDSEGEANASSRRLDDDLPPSGAAPLCFRPRN